MRLNSPMPKERQVFDEDTGQPLYQIETGMELLKRHLGIKDDICDAEADKGSTHDERVRRRSTDLPPSDAQHPRRRGPG